VFHVGRAECSNSSFKKCWSHSKCVSHKNAINCSSLQFPVEPKQFSVFEHDNPDIALHCLAIDKQNKTFAILYLSPHMHSRSKQISLLLLDSPDGRDEHHVWVKNLPHLVTNRNEHHRHVCWSCLHAFKLHRVLKQHEPNCLTHAPQQCVYQYPYKATLSFNKHHCEFTFDFYLVADFECFLRPTSADDDGDAKPNVDAFHVPSGFCVVPFTSLTTNRMVPTPSCIRVTTWWGNSLVTFSPRRRQ